jgi:hypothetical protein
MGRKRTVCGRQTRTERQVDGAANGRSAVCRGLRAANAHGAASGRSRKWTECGVPWAAAQTRTERQVDGAANGRSAVCRGLRRKRVRWALAQAWTECRRQACTVGRAPGGKRTGCVDGRSVAPCVRRSCWEGGAQARTEGGAQARTAGGAVTDGVRAEETARRGRPATAAAIVAPFASARYTAQHHFSFTQGGHRHGAGSDHLLGGAFRLR